MGISQPLPVFPAPLPFQPPPPTSAALVAGRRHTLWHPHLTPVVNDGNGVRAGASLGGGGFSQAAIAFFTEILELAGARAHSAPDQELGVRARALWGPYGIGPTDLLPAPSSGLSSKKDFAVTESFQFPTFPCDVVAFIIDIEMAFVMR